MTDPKQWSLTLQPELSVADAAALKQMLVIDDPDDADPDATFQAALQGLATLAFEEHVQALLGAEELAGKVDLRQRRLLRIVDKVFGGRMPPASIVGLIFHIPERSAASLISTTAARFQRLDEARRLAASKALNKLSVKTARADDEPGEYYLVSRDTAAVAYLRDLLARSSENVPALVREPALAATYTIRDAALVHLCGVLGLEIEETRPDQG